MSETSREKTKEPKGFPLWTPRHSALEVGGSSPARRVVSMGWHPDLPDMRDRNLKHPDVDKKLKSAKSIIVSKDPIPEMVNHRKKCSPVEDQGDLGSCTAQAVVGLMEYMMRRGYGEHVDGSRLFTYKVTRNLLGWAGDRGAYLRTAMQSVAAFGVPPEKHWPYDIHRFDEEPSAFLYSYAENYKALNYARLDPVGTGQAEVLTALKRVLAAGFCVVFGFTVYSSLSGESDIPYPTPTDSVLGGHAVMAVGYDDNHKPGNGRKKAVPSLIIRNSWGTDWGDVGYGYLPYSYVLEGLSRDFWTAFKREWIDTKQFD